MEQRKLERNEKDEKLFSKVVSKNLILAVLFWKNKAFFMLNVFKIIFQIKKSIFFSLKLNDQNCNSFHSFINILKKVILTI